MQTDHSIVKNYFLLLFQILRSPAFYFRHLSAYEGKTRPLVFAMVTNWIGAAIYFLWNGSRGNKNHMSEWISKWVETWQLTQNSTQYETWLPTHDTGQYQAWAAGIGSVVLTPFSTLITILLMSTLIYIASRIFTARETSFNQAVQVTSYAQASQIFLIFPMLGVAIAMVYKGILLLIGAREVYHIGNIRAAIIAFFPYLLSVVMMMMLLAFSLIIGLVLFSLLFSMAVV